MQQFYTLFKKEISGYFQNRFAPLMVFIYLAVSVGAAFYSGYTKMHDTALYALFSSQLYIMAALMPALTMRLWAEEYKSGTIEFLLTQPLRYYQPVAAKAAAAFIFGIFFSLLLLPFIWEASNQINIDWGNILCAYCGLWLVILVFSTAGALISSLNKNTIAVYLLSLSATVLPIAISVSHFRAAYTDFLLAEINIGDVFYFLALSATFFLLNVTVLRLNASAQSYKILRFCAFCALLLSGTAALCLAVYVLLPHKFDMTMHRLYTPQTLSKQIAESLKGPISIDVYISKDYVERNTEYARYYQQVMRFLKKYEKLSNKKIKVSAIKVEPFSKLENIVLSSQLYYEENIYGSKDYFGAVIRNENGEGVVIRHFLAARGPYLEKDVDVALLKLSRDDVLKNVGVYLDVLQNIDDFQGFLLNLENDYNTVSIPEDIYEISPLLDLLILINPKEVPPYFTNAVDKYLAAGGKVLLFFDFLTDNQPNTVNMKSLNFLGMINRLGLTFSGNLIDNAKADTNVAKSGLPVRLYKAVEFDATDDKYATTPIITNGEHLVGVLLQEKNSVGSANSAQVALFGDTDMLIDNNWIAAQSPDKNPYDTVYKSANIEILRGLIDKILGNDIYNSLPVRYERQNTFSISDKIYNLLYEINAPIYLRLSSELLDARTAVDDGIFQNPDKIAQMLQISEAGQKISELELQTENLIYNVSQQYQQRIRIMMVSQILLTPLLLALLLALIIFIAQKKQQRIVWRFMDE
ncbi:MAG: Gldg family protein [Alphaproteobacteria bacterium]|nr:Gldg family protein [Alphaproteobacteria bacterium]